MCTGFGAILSRFFYIMLLLSVLHVAVAIETVSLQMTATIFFCSAWACNFLERARRTGAQRGGGEAVSSPPVWRAQFFSVKGDLPISRRSKREIRDVVCGWSVCEAAIAWPHGEEEPRLLFTDISRSWELDLNRLLQKNRRNKYRNPKQPSHASTIS